MPATEGTERGGGCYANALAQIADVLHVLEYLNAKRRRPELAGNYLR